MSAHLDEQPKWGQLFVIGSAVAAAQVGTIVILFGPLDSVNDWLDPYLLYPLSLLAIYFTAPVLFIGAMMLVANRLPAASDSNQITGGKTARIMRDYGMIFVSALALLCIALLDLSVLTLINWINDHQMQATALGSAFPENTTVSVHQPANLHRRHSNRRSDSLKRNRSDLSTKRVPSQRSHPLLCQFVRRNSPLPHGGLLSTLFRLRRFYRKHVCVLSDVHIDIHPRGRQSHRNH